MLLSLYSMYKRDKYIEHPVIGNVTCSGFQDGFKKCSELLNTSKNINVQCLTMFDLSYNCYKSKNDEEFIQWIDNQIQEKDRLTQFLQKNESILPQLQKKHMVYDIFTIKQEELKEMQSMDSQKIQQFYQQEIDKNKEFFEKKN